MSGAISAKSLIGEPKKKRAISSLAGKLELAGELIIDKLTHAPGNNAPIGGLKIVTRSGWFAARPSGTENVYKIYAESFRDQSHLEALVNEAQRIVDYALL
jgi:phosphoglucomutase